MPRILRAVSWGRAVLAARIILKIILGSQSSVGGCLVRASFRLVLGLVVVLTVTLAACAPSTTTAPAEGALGSSDVCPAPLDKAPHCLTPHALRVAYDMQALSDRGDRGRGQTIVDIVSFGSPTLQRDLDAFDRQFGLPTVTVTVRAPIGSVPFDAQNKEQFGWAVETELDIEIMHAMAPDAGLVVLTSPVDETEGTMGLPEFQRLEQYAVDHHLGTIFSQSWAASEATLADAAGQSLVKSYGDFYHTITTRDGITVLSGTGDNGATDYADVGMNTLANTPTIDFPADVPWVTAVGGTTIHASAGGYIETAWSGSSGGVSAFIAEPTFQSGLPAAAQTILGGHRGVPDVAADANTSTAMALYLFGGWHQVGGTSASTPLWAALMAVANQMAGHPLGYINPALYQVATSGHYAQDFRDVTAGDNTVDKPPVHVRGYAASAGWDAVTGWGAPLCSHLIPDLIAAAK